MNKLLLSESFDLFLLEEGTVTVANTYHIDGHIRKDFYTKEEQTDASVCPYDFSSWKEMRPLCFQLIKGKRTPISFKFVLRLLPEQMEKILAVGNYDNRATSSRRFLFSRKIRSGAGLCYHCYFTDTFIMDKTPEQLLG